MKLLWENYIWLFMNSDLFFFCVGMLDGIGGYIYRFDEDAGRFVLMYVSKKYKE